MSSAVVAVRPSELEGRALSVAEHAKTIEVRDQATYAAAAKFLLDVITPMMGEVHQAYDSIVKKNYEAWQEACAKRKVHLEPLEQAKVGLGAQIAAYEAEQLAKRSAERPKDWKPRSSLRKRTARHPRRSGLSSSNRLSSLNRPWPPP
jgi:hypothetical protein